MSRLIGNSVNSFPRFVVIFFTCAVLLIVDTNTIYLSNVRSALSLMLGPVRVLAQVPSYIANGFDNAFSNEADMTVAYDNLHDEYFELKAELLKMRSLETENQRLRSLLKASDNVKHKLVMADLQEVSLDPYYHRVVISRGASDGVYVGQAVLDDHGIVGQVTDVLPNTAAVTLITDPGHSVPVSVERSGLRTLISGTGDLFQLSVPFLNENPDIQVGDRLMSSGLGGRFPEGYPVAIVREITTHSGQAFSEITAESVAKVNRLRQVLLVSPIESLEEIKARLK